MFPHLPFVVATALHCHLPFEVATGFGGVPSRCRGCRGRVYVLAFTNKVLVCGARARPARAMPTPAPARSHRPSIASLCLTPCAIRPWCARSQGGLVPIMRQLPHAPGAADNRPAARRRDGDESPRRDASAPAWPPPLLPPRHRQGRALGIPLDGSCRPEYKYMLSWHAVADGNNQLLAFQTPQ